MVIGQQNKMSFAQQRLQVLALGINSDALPNSYVYAWSYGVYPVKHDRDSLKLPHEDFPADFRVDRESVSKVIEYLEYAWITKQQPTFDELESRFEGVIDRMSLVHICRYAYLDGLFNDELWLAIDKNYANHKLTSKIADNFSTEEIFF